MFPLGNSKLCLCLLGFVVSVGALLTSGCGGSPAKLPTPQAVSSTGGAPAGTPTLVFPHIEENTASDPGGTASGTTGSCGSITCAGGIAVATQQLVSRVTQPSLDGGSTRFQVSGKNGADGLWWFKLGPHDGVSNLQFDFWLNVSPEAAQHAQALEFDTFQFVSPTRYMFGTQCDYAAGYQSGTWDVWDEKAQGWQRTSFPCPGFVPGDWYHVTWNFHRSSDKMEHYDTVSVQHYDSSGKTQIDGGTTQVNIALNSAPLPKDWTDNLGVQFQLDLHGSASYSTVVDQVTLSAW
jgi:hypothetical protein